MKLVCFSDQTLTRRKRRTGRDVWEKAGYEMLSALCHQVASHPCLVRLFHRAIVHHTDSKPATQPHRGKNDFRPKTHRRLVDSNRRSNSVDRQTASTKIVHPIPGRGTVACAIDRRRVIRLRRPRSVDVLRHVSSVLFVKTFTDPVRPYTEKLLPRPPSAITFPFDGRCFCGGHFSTIRLWTSIRRRSSKHDVNIGRLATL